MPITWILLIIKLSSRNSFKRHYPHNQNYFVDFSFLHFENLHNILRTLKEKITFIAQIFWKFVTLKNVVTWMPESFRFITPLRNQHVPGSQTLTNSAWPHFYHDISSIQDKSALENISPSQIWELRIVWQHVDYRSYELSS